MAPNGMNLLRQNILGRLDSIAWCIENLQDPVALERCKNRKEAFDEVMALIDTIKEQGQ